MGWKPFAQLKRLLKSGNIMLWFYLAAWLKVGTSHVTLTENRMMQVANLISGIDTDLQLTRYSFSFLAQSHKCLILYGKPHPNQFNWWSVSRPEYFFKRPCLQPGSRVWSTNLKYCTTATAVYGQIMISDVNKTSPHVKNEAHGLIFKEVQLVKERVDSGER